MKQQPMEKGTVEEGSNGCGMMRGDEGICPCPLEGVIDTVGKKWTLSIVTTIGNHDRLRFGELQEKLAGISPKTLADRLKELERMKLVDRKAYAEIPPRVEYSLTEGGEGLRRAAIPLMEWASKQGHSTDQKFVFIKR
jgi:DNA-binding HxlR family transcriptional regulator